MREFGALDCFGPADQQDVEQRMKHNTRTTGKHGSDSVMQ